MCLKTYAFKVELSVNPTLSQLDCDILISDMYFLAFLSIILKVALFYCFIALER